MPRRGVLSLLLIAGGALAIGSWVVTARSARARDVGAPAPTGYIERLVDHPGRLRFTGTGAYESAGLLAYRWSEEDLDHEWQRHVDGDMVTLRSPPLDFHHLREIDSISIQVGEIGETMRFALHWNDAATLSGPALYRNRREVTILDEGPSGTFVIRGENLLDAASPADGGTVPRYLFLRFPLSDDGRLTFRSVGVLGSAARLASTGSGRTRRDVRGEVRDALFTPTPGTITYRTTLGEDADLLFGVHSEDPRAVVTYTVTVEDPDGRSAVRFRETVASDGVWQDFRVGLFNGQVGTYVVTLTADSDRERNTVFWSNPMIRTRSAGETRPNVILYVVDALRADHMSLYGYPKETTPFLDELSRQGLVFRHGYASSTWTKPSIATLMTSLHPQTHGVGERSYADILPDSVDTLQDHLRLNGYITASFSANLFSGALSNLDQGFDYTFSIDAFAIAGRDVKQNKIHSDDLNARILPWIEAHADDRFYLYIHSVDTHRPFAPPELPPHLRSDVADDVALYDAEIYFNDQQIRRLYALLEQKAIARDTLLIVTADHGESLGEHGQNGHGNSVYQEESHIPVIMVHPGSLAAGISERAVQLVDLMPTILTYAEVPFDRDTAQGVNVLGGEDDDASARIVFITKFTYPDHLEAPAFSQTEMYGVVEGHWKLIVRQDAEQATPRVELYDLSTDPHETHDLSEVERGRTHALRGRLVEFLAQQRRARRSFIEDHTFDTVSASTARETLEDVWDHLRGLGYIR